MVEFKVPEPDCTRKRSRLVPCLYKVSHGFENVPSWTWHRLSSLRAPVGLDDIFDCPPANGAARIGHLLEFETAGVAETHVPTGVEDRVHCILIADGAFITPWAGAGWEGGGLWMVREWRAWGCTCWGGKERVVVGVETWIEVDIQRSVEVGLRVATAKHCGCVWCTWWRAGHRWASQVWVLRWA